MLLIAVAGCAPTEQVELYFGYGTRTVLIAIVHGLSTDAFDFENVLHVAEVDDIPYGLEAPEDYDVWIFEYGRKPEDVGLPRGTLHPSLACRSDCCRDLPVPLEQPRGLQGTERWRVPEWYLNTRLDYADTEECLRDGRGVELSSSGARCCGEASCQPTSFPHPTGPAPPHPPCFGSTCGAERFTFDCDESSRLGGGCNEDLSACSSDDWPSYAPPGAIYVDASASAAGTGVRGAPLRTIDEALGVATSTIILLRAGVHQAPRQPIGAFTLRGACAAHTYVVSSTTTPVDVVGRAELRDLTVSAVAGSQPAAMTVSRGSVTIRNVIVRGNAFRVDDCGAVEADGLVVVGDVAVSSGGRIASRNAFVDGALSCSEAFQCGARTYAELRLTRSVVDGRIVSGRGCHVSVGESLVVGETSSRLIADGGSLDVTDSVARSGDGACDFDTVVSLSYAEEVALRRVAFEGGRTTVGLSDTSVSGVDVQIRSDCDRGRGIQASDARVYLERSTIQGGLHVNDSEVDIVDARVWDSDRDVGAAIGMAEFQGGRWSPSLTATRVAVAAAHTGIRTNGVRVTLTDFQISDVSVGVWIRGASAWLTLGTIEDVSNAIHCTSGSVDAQAVRFSTGWAVLEDQSITIPSRIRLTGFEVDDYQQFFLGVPSDRLELDRGSVSVPELGFEVGRCAPSPIMVDDVIWNRVEGP